MALRGGIRIFSQRDNQRVDRLRRGRIRGISAAEPQPQTIESTICDFASVVGRATTSLRYVFSPSGKAESIEEPVHDGDLQRIQEHSHFPSGSGCRASTSSRSVFPCRTERSTPLHRVISSGWTLRPSQIRGNLSSCLPFRSLRRPSRARSLQKPAPQEDDSFISYIYEHLTS